MTYELAPLVRACVNGENIIFLDLRRDRYWCVARNEAPAIRDLVEGSGASAGRLSALDLIRPCIREGELARSTPLATAARFVRSCALTAMVLRAKRLDLLFGAISGRKRHAAHRRAPSVTDVAEFERLRPWWPRARVCLFDSAALTLFLINGSRRADLVIGVRTNPFAAHAWVEADGAVVADQGEQCSSFTPIARV